MSDVFTNQEVLVIHANARLNLHGRRLLVSRVIDQGRPVAHVAKELGISRQCAHRWVTRFRVEGEPGLMDRSSRPHHCPRRTPSEVEQRILRLRVTTRRGQDWLGAELGVPARTVSAVLRRYRIPYLADCDPLTGEVIRASRATQVRYERARPGELVHIDVKKLGRIPEGGGWRTQGTRVINHPYSWRVRIGYDYIHSVVDDHSRLAYCEALPDERGETAAAFLRRAADYFATHGIHVIEEVMSDNAFAFRRSRAFAHAVAALGARQRFTRPHCPWQNGKVERFNRTIQIEWAYREIFTSNADRTAALAPWLEHYNTQRRHWALGGLPPISRLS
jgi:transposase InsO family protein